MIEVPREQDVCHAENPGGKLEKIQDNDLVMISESDVLITTGRFMEPLKGNFKAWIFWAETALYGSKFNNPA